MGNRFDALRLAAALGVFASHGVFLYALRLPVPFAGHSLGSLSVYVFFFINPRTQRLDFRAVDEFVEPEK